MPPMDEILTVMVVVVAAVVIGFIFGMFALSGVKRRGFTPPRLWKLTPEQTFGLGGVLLTLAWCSSFLWR